MQQTHFISSSSTAHINFRHYVCSTITTPFRHCCYYCSKRFIHVDLFILRHNFLFPFQFLPFPHSVPAASYSIPLQTNFVLLEANWTLFYIYIWLVVFRSTYQIFICVIWVQNWIEFIWCVVAGWWQTQSTKDEYELVRYIDYIYTSTYISIRKKSITCSCHLISISIHLTCTGIQCFHVMARII